MTADQENEFEKFERRVDAAWKVFLPVTACVVLGLWLFAGWPFLGAIAVSGLVALATYGAVLIGIWIKS